jgi:uncharacterized membrane protein YgdD (TMEM256/DUF423 family)
MSLPLTGPARLAAAVALTGFTAVLLGALGAHALKDALLSRGTTAAWETAAHYQLAHALAALAALAWSAAAPAHAPALRRIAGWWLLGAWLFAGSIYTLALGGPRFLGPVTPLGGLAFLTGWALLFVLALRLGRDPADPDAR